MATRLFMSSAPRPPELAVFDFRRKRRDRPFGGLGGDDVQVPEQDHRRFFAVAFQARDQIAASGRRFDDLGVDAVFFQHVMDVARGGDFVARGVGGVDAD
jgi:hypothetical protein